MNKIKKMITITLISIIFISFPIISTSAAPTKPTLLNNPINGQILPFYEVWLRWVDVSNEAHYTMTIRDLGLGGNLGDAGPLIYN